MAKYVCDFETVSAVGQQLSSSASEMTSATSEYSGKFESSLSSWQGSSKSGLITQYKGQVDISNQKAQYLNEFGEFIVTTVQAIQELESQLSGLDI